MSAEYQPNDTRFLLGGEIIDDIEPVKKDSPKTKVGRLNLRGRRGDQRVKVFEAHNAAHARFIEHSSRQSEWETFFPQVLFVHEQFVVSEWVEGKPLFHPHLPFIRYRTSHMTRFLKDAGRILGAFHDTPVTEDMSPGFDYVADFIHPRFVEACRVADRPDFTAVVEQAQERLLQKTGVASCRSHPDLTPANVIFDETGQMVVIDNELLGSTRFKFLDEINLLYSLPRETVKAYRPALKMLMGQTLALLALGLEEEVFSMWAMRRIGSYHAAGDSVKIRNFVDSDPDTRRKNIREWNLLEQLRL